MTQICKSSHTVLGGCGGPRILKYCTWECRTVQYVWKVVLWFLKKLNTDLNNPAIPLVGIYPREMEACIYTKTWM